MIKSRFAYFVWTVIMLIMFSSFTVSIWLAFSTGQFNYLLFGTFWLIATFITAQLPTEKK